MGHIFISYSHKDTAYAHKLYQYLFEHSLDAWIDDRLDYGSRWPHEIEKRIRDSYAFILIMSPYAYESEWVQNELSLARELGKPVYPLLLDGDPWWHLRTTQYVNVKTGELPPTKFFVSLTELASKSQSKETSPVAIHINGNVDSSVINVGNENIISTPLSIKNETIASVNPTPKGLSQHNRNIVLAMIGFVSLIVVILIGMSRENWFPTVPVETAVHTSTPTLLSLTPTNDRTLTPTFVSPCHISAVKLIGNWVDAGYPETDAFTFKDIDNKRCKATFKDDVLKLFDTSNLWFENAVACTTCHFDEVKASTMHLDLSSYAGIVAGSHRANGEPKGNDILGGGNWTEALLYKFLYAPDGKTELNPVRPAMPLGRGSLNPPPPAEGPIIPAGVPVQ